jgi:hypothetical protein
MTRWVKPRRGPAPLSGDRMDKFIAAMSWYVGKDKSDREYITSPFYYSAVWEWFGRLSLDKAELAGTVHELYVTPRYGEKVALDYAQDLPAAPRYPL